MTTYAYDPLTHPYSRCIIKEGYVHVYVPMNAHMWLRPMKHRMMDEHLLVAEDALGHALPTGAVIHHVDEDKSNNRKCNLVILASNAEHAALHARLRVLRAGGNPWTERICSRCRGFMPSSRRGFYCQGCDLERHREYGRRRVMCEECREWNRKMATKNVCWRCYGELRALRTKEPCAI